MYTEKEQLNILHADSKYMKQALELASLGTNFTSPNPRVGAVIVKKGHIIARGYHHVFGAKHAEIEAIDSATESLKDSTLYVTLEPCNHFGKTPPCSERIVQEGIKRVVIAIEDPNLKSGSIAYLRKNHIEITVDVEREAAYELNKDFFSYVELKRPYVSIKTAMSWDGKIATHSGESKWISSGDSREFTMDLRAYVDAIVIGASTANIDKPLLTYRGRKFPAKNPKRVIIDAGLKTDKELELLKENCIIFTSKASYKAHKEKYKFTNAELISVSDKDGILEISEILKSLYEKGMMSILVEGGGTTISQFFEQGFVDRVMFIYSPVIIGGKNAPTACDGIGVSALANKIKLENIKQFNIGQDMLMQGDVVASRQIADSR